MNFVLISILFLALAVLFPFGAISIANFALDLISKHVIYKGADLGSDCAWYDQSRIKGSFSYERNFSTYITMRDGVEIAVDVYLPKNWDGTPLPTIAHFTRYNRAFAFNSPLYEIFQQVNLRTMISVRYLTNNGYAFISVDVRGTGASTGHRDVDMSNDEVTDFKEVLDWLVSQPFCNGRIGSLGSSYDGIASEMLTIHKHKALKSIAVLFSPFNAYTDVGMPGGVLCDGMLKNYDRMTVSMETSNFERLYSIVPLPLKIILKYLLRGVAPVDDSEEHLKLVDAALEEHKMNWKMKKRIFEVNSTYLDDIVYDGLTIPDLGGSPKFSRAISDSGVYAYYICSYWDSACLSGIQNRLKDMDSSRIKVTIGPWNHAMAKNADVFSLSEKVCFNMFAELVRWFDATLKDNCDVCYRHNVPNPLSEKEERFHYSTYGRLGFRSCKETQFPCDSSAIKKAKFHFAADSALLKGADSENVSNLGLEYAVDYTAKTVEVSRWNLVSQTRGFNVKYPNRVDEDEKLIYFESGVLDSENDVVITGTPFIHMNITPDAYDGVFIAYLSDVSLNIHGKEEEKDIFVQYITEGIVRGIHKLNFDDQRESNYFRKNGRHLNTNLDDRSKPVGNVIEFELQPISYALKRGHRLRVSLAGADRLNFNTDLHSVLPTKWIVHDGYVEVPFEK